MTDRKIDGAARAYMDAGVALGDLLLAKLHAEAPDVVAKASQAMEHGERLQLVLEFHPERPRIVWQVVNDYEQPKALVTIPARMPTRQ